MTDEFKKKLFDYITGNYNIESGIDTPYARNKKNITTNVYNLLNAMSSDYVIVNTTRDITNNFIIFYGHYATATKGFVAIINENFEMKQLITSYSGGNYLPALYFLNYDDSGSFYGIGVSNGIKKLYLFNNFCVKLEEDDFEIIFRQSYTLDGSLQNGLLYNIINVVKRKNSGSYLFIMPYTVSNDIASQFIVSKLTINVGSSNDWVHTIYTASLYIDYASLYGEWQDENYFYKFSENFYGYKEYSGNNGGTLSNKTLALPVSGFGNSVANSLTYSYCCSNASTADEAILAIYKITNGTSYEELYSFNVTKPSTYATRISLTLIDNIICFDYSYPYQSGIYIYYQGVGGRIINDEAYLMSEYNADAFDTPIYFIKRQYNKINYYLTILGNSLALSYIEIYNSSNYNGLDYQALNSMIPESSILYDDSDKIVFARNLYNKTINNGTTTSTLEVPNNYLNDINISKEELISETNSILNSDTTLIEKNIYEQLYINFINTLNVIDKNTTTSVLNPTGASRINNSISQTMDYDDTKIVKFVINYSDNTSDIRNFCSKTYSSTENRCTYTCIIYVPTDKSITNIQIKSNDGNTTYLTINTSSLESGKFYRLSQDLVVE